jgi:hypothetical protein
MVSANASAIGTTPESDTIFILFPSSANAWLERLCVRLGAQRSKLRRWSRDRQRVSAHDPPRSADPGSS